MGWCIEDVFCGGSESVLLRPLTQFHMSSPDNVLSRNAGEASRRNSNGGEEEGAYRTMPETHEGWQRLPSAGEMYQDRTLNGLAIITVPYPVRLPPYGFEEEREGKTWFNTE